MSTRDLDCLWELHFDQVAQAAHFGQIGSVHPQIYHQNWVQYRYIMKRVAQFSQAVVSNELNRGLERIKRQGQGRGGQIAPPSLPILLLPAPDILWNQNGGQTLNKLKIQYSPTKKLYALQAIPFWKILTEIVYRYLFMIMTKRNETQ